MSRPPKLGPIQEARILDRLLNGERPADLAREFGLSKSAFSERFMAQVQTIRVTAAKLVQAVDVLQRLSPKDQWEALKLVERLRGDVAL